MKVADKDPPRSQLSFDYGETLSSSVRRILNFKMDTSGVIPTTFNESESFLVHVSLGSVASAENFHQLRRNDGQGSCGIPIELTTGGVQDLLDPRGRRTHFRREDRLEDPRGWSATSANATWTSLYFTPLRDSTNVKCKILWGSRSVADRLPVSCSPSAKRRTDARTTHNTCA